MITFPRQIIAIVPAAGIGSRMQTDRPKQYLELHGKTVLEHTLNTLLSYPPIQRIIVAVAKEDPYLSRLALIHHPKISVVEGGAERADSVLSGLRQITEEDAWVMVHDAARPCLSHSDLDNLLKIQDDNGAILAIPATDTIKRADTNKQIQETEDRSCLWLAQTPQFFKAALLRKALEKALQKSLSITDEASAMELDGFRPHLVAGRSDNLKITRPEDLALAEFYLAKRNKETI